MFGRFHYSRIRVGVLKNSRTKYRQQPYVINKETSNVNINASCSNSISGNISIGNVNDADSDIMENSKYYANKLTEINGFIVLRRNNCW